MTTIFSLGNRTKNYLKMISTNLFKMDSSYAGKVSKKQLILLYKELNSVKSKR